MWHSRALIAESRVKAPIKEPTRAPLAWITMNAHVTVPKRGMHRLVGFGSATGQDSPDNRVNIRPETLPGFALYRPGAPSGFQVRRSRGQRFLMHLLIARTTVELN